TEPGRRILFALNYFPSGIWKGRASGAAFFIARPHLADQPQTIMAGTRGWHPYSDVDRRQEAAVLL
ncbi:MAG: hypothetical protein ABJD57_12410, partial [Roseibium sp.]|uniref:hypothetical protein n=1 Tax=Roseibium sp. TaxID=1936156 RepID=UPI0032650622